MRDWGRSLFSASFGGFPFKVEKEKDPFGKKLVIHEFPLRDDPFIEDLGNASRHFDLTAYLASDTCDVEATALQATLLAFGPAILVLPDQGPVICFFKNGTRDRERDREGYVAFSLSFVSQGAATPVISAAFLGQLVFDAASVLATAGSSLLNNLTL